MSVFRNIRVAYYFPELRPLILRWLWYQSVMFAYFLVVLIPAVIIWALATSAERLSSFLDLLADYMMKPVRRLSKLKYEKIEQAHALVSVERIRARIYGETVRILPKE